MLLRAWFRLPSSPRLIYCLRNGCSWKSTRFLLFVFFFSAARRYCDGFVPNAGPEFRGPRWSVNWFTKHAGAPCVKVIISRSIVACFWRPAPVGQSRENDVRRAPRSYVVFERQKYVLCHCSCPVIVFRDGHTPYRNKITAVVYVVVVVVVGGEQFVRWKSHTGAHVRVSSVGRIAVTAAVLLFRAIVGRACLKYKSLRVRARLSGVTGPLPCGAGAR